jgi:flagellar hook-associated protein 2
MANAIDGIGTINVGTLVSQLMSVEGNSQTLLKNKQSAEQTKLTALQTLNTQVLAVRTAAEKIVGSLYSPSTTWNTQSASSSSSSVAVTAAPSAATGTMTFDVLSTAATHRALFSGTVSSTQALANGPLTITRADGSTATVDLSSATTMSELVSAINASGGLGVKAIAVKISDDAYRLSLTAAESGAGAAFTVSGLDPALGTSSVATQGADATIKIGSADTDVVTSKTNTFTDVMPGLTFTVTKPETGVTVSVGRDTSTMTSQVQSLVGALNSALGTISSKSTYDTTNKVGGAFLGEGVTRALSSDLANGVLGGGSLADYGVQLDRYGKVTFDAAAFAKKAAADPDATVAAMTALATRVGTVAKKATDYGTGSLTTAISSRQSTVKTLTASISDWDDRLSRKKAALTAQFSALNTQLSKLNNQASWLSGQLSSLSSTSTSKSSG